MKKSCHAYQGYLTCRGETTRPPELSRPPRRVRVPNVTGWLNFGKKQAKRYLDQGNSGGRVKINGALDNMFLSDAHRKTPTKQSGA